MVKRIGNKQYPLHRCFGLLNLDLNAEDSDHEGEGSAIDDQAEAADHEPGEDEADDVVLPLGRQPAQRLLQHLQIYHIVESTRIETFSPRIMYFSNIF